MIIDVIQHNAHTSRKDRINGGLLYEYNELEQVWYKKCGTCKKFKILTTDNFYTFNNKTRGLKIISKCKECSKTPRKQIEFFNSNGELLCSCCKEYLSLDNFYHSSSKQNINRGQKDSYCKVCSLVKKRSRWKNTEPNVKLFIYKIWEGAQARTFNTKRSSTKDKEFNITREYLQELYEKQNGLCAITGKQMTYLHSSGRVFTNMSLDRKDSNVGYIEGNVQFVCVIVNLMKNTMTLEELKDWCKSIIEHNP